MRNLLIVFFSLILLLLVLIFPFKTRFMAHFNLLKMKGFYSIKVLFIKILCGMIYTENGKIYVSNIADAITPKYTSPFMKELTDKLIPKINVKKMEIFFTGGFAEDSFTSAIVCGSVTSLVQTLYSVLSQKYENVKLYEDVSPTFGKDNLELTIDMVVSFSLIQLFVAIISAAISSNKVKENVNER